MSQTLDIQTDAEGRIVGLSGNFSKQTNSNGAEDHFAPDSVSLTVPENTEAHVTASMTVDDWGYIDITPASGASIRAIDLTSSVESPGPRGGHVRWSAQTSDDIVLAPGQYSITVRQDNAPYNEAYAAQAGNNVSFCQASVSIEYAMLPVRTLSVKAKLKVVAGFYPLEMNRDVELLADVIGTGENTQITNLRVGDYDNSSETSVSPTGEICQIILLSVNAEFASPTVISTETNTVARRARLFWSARILDPLDTVLGNDRTVSGSTQGTEDEPTFSTSLN